jgi:hypothetical protein
MNAGRSACATRLATTHQANLGRVFKVLSIGACLVLLGACSGAKSSGSPGGNVSVKINESSTSVIVNQQFPFTVTVTGTTNIAVTWEVNGVAGGNATVGTISATGTYTAPAQVPTPATVTITAVSQADTTKSASVSVIIVASNANQKPQSAPIVLGTVGGNANDTAPVGNLTQCCVGTLGSLVQRNGNLYILSNNHVLAREDDATIGESIEQPGACGANPLIVAHLTQFANLESNTTNTDSAIAQIVPGMVDPSGAIFSLGATATGNTADNGVPHQGAGVTPLVGMTVAKSGGTTGLTCSSIAAIGITTQISYKKKCDTGTTFTVTYNNQVSVAGGTFSAFGDSGSLIVSQGTADPVALLYGGSDTDTVGNPIADVLTAMADSQGNKPVFVGSASTHQVIGCTLPHAGVTVQPQAAAQVSQEAMSRAAAARDVFANQMLTHPHVYAVGVAPSLDHPGEAAVAIFVNAGVAPAALPAQLNGVRTRIITASAKTPRGVLTDVRAAAAVPVEAEFPVTTLSPKELTRAKTVHAAHVAELMKLAGVQGVGITSSADAPGEAALMIFTVRGAKQDPIPAVIDGLRTRIRESSPFRAGLGAQERACRVPAAGAAVRAAHGATAHAAPAVSARPASH